jgi:hypothetical protein
MLKEGVTAYYEQLGNGNSRAARREAIKQGLFDFGGRHGAKMHFRRTAEQHKIYYAWRAKKQQPTG